MAILIVDDETSTRQALREILTHLGHTTILEAKNGEEALRIVQNEKSRIRMIIADWEMPYMDGLAFLERVAREPALDLAPFLLITSDALRPRLSAYQKDHSRLDSYLLKPFRVSGLSKSLNDAFLHRLKERDTIAYLGPKAPEPLRAAVARARSFHWRQLIEGAEASMALREPSPSLGAIILEPGTLLAPEIEALGGFKKSPLGTVTPVICASRDPAELFPARNLAQRFVDARAASDKDWDRILGELSRSAQAAWQTDPLQREARQLIQQKRFDEARKLCQRILALDSDNGENHNLAAEAFEGVGRLSEARDHYEASIRLNPCSPRPYIRLFEILAHERAKLKAVTASAAEFCPQNFDVILAAARSLKECGELARSKELVERVLRAQPNHAAARELLASFLC